MIVRMAYSIGRAAQSDKGIITLFCFVLAATAFTALQYEGLDPSNESFQEGRTRQLLEDMIVADGSERLKDLLGLLSDLSGEELHELADEIEIRSLMKELDEDEYLNRFHRVRKFSDEKFELSCEYNNENDSPEESECYELLEPKIKDKKAWFFFGDSQMGKYFNAIDYPYEITHKKKTEDLRCGFLDYVHIPRADKWEYPDWKQGPAKFGRKNHFCSDVASAGNRRYEADTTAGTNFMELLTVDFANDVEQQTPYTKTTQETAVLHVANQLQLRGLTYEDSVCVVNVGLHDQKLCEKKSDPHCLMIYNTNVKKYLNLLYNVCGSFIWLSTTPVRDSHNPNYPQRNDRMEIMNEDVKEIVAKFENGYFVDVWDMALEFGYVDNAHFSQEYYESVAGLISKLM